MANSPESVLYSPCVVEYSLIGMLALGRLSCSRMAGGFLLLLAMRIIETLLLCAFYLLDALIARWEIFGHRPA